MTTEPTEATEATEATDPTETMAENGSPTPPAVFWDVDAVDAMDFDPFMTEALQRDGLLRIRMPHGAEDAWLVSQYEHVKQVTNDPRFSREGLTGRNITRLAPHMIPLGDAVGFADPPEHTRLRKAASRAFTSRHIEKLRPHAERRAAELLDGMERAGSPADVMEYFITPFSLAGMSELMGIPPEDWPKMQEWTRLIISSSVGREGSERAKKEMGAYFDALADRRAADPRDDLLSHLVEAEREGRMTRSELVGFAELMQTSGFNSVRFNTANMVYLLLTHPAHLDRLRAEPGLLPQAIEELLRFIPHRNAVGMPRVAVEDVTVGTTTIRKGEAVYVSYLAANRDPRCFADPDRMDFDRSPNPHVAFGHGPHYCAGSPLARMEQQVMLRGLLDRFPHLRLAVAPREIVWRRGELIRGPAALPVAW